MNYKERSVENLAHLQQEMTNDAYSLRTSITNIETQLGMNTTSIGSHSGNISKLDALIEG
jgi:hypothetical protein